MGGPINSHAVRPQDPSHPYPLPLDAAVGQDVPLIMGTNGLSKKMLVTQKTTNIAIVATNHPH